MSRFDRKKADELLVAVRAGASNEVACQHAGIKVGVMREWLKKNTTFRAEVDKARADLELLAVGTVRRGMADDSNAARWVAERVRGDSELERLRELTT